MLRRLAWSVALGMGLLAAGTARLSAQVRVFVRAGPPAAVVERVPVRPGPAFLWVPGHYNWAEGGYAWTRGYWALPPRHAHRWVPGHWARERRGWFWMEGHWR
jgi:hypothetical protein